VKVVFDTNALVSALVFPGGRGEAALRRIVTAQQISRRHNRPSREVSESRAGMLLRPRFASAILTQLSKRHKGECLAKAVSSCVTMSYTVEIVDDYANHTS
jgi:predicted nucleic acid-binding protein